MTTEPATDQLIAEIEATIAHDASLSLTPPAHSKFIALISRIRKEQEDKAVMARALKGAKEFIENGIEVGFIRVPRDAFDHANDTLASIRAALTGSTIISDMEAEIERLKAAAALSEEALKHARGQIQHPDQLIDEAIDTLEALK